jgi:hypothetical protein
MAVSLQRCAEFLAAARIRHHDDVEQGVIRVVRLTREYRNLRDEKLVILQITTPDDGRRCRLTIERAFAVGDDAAATCRELCRAAADTPLVGVEFDADYDNLRMVVEVVVEDGELTQRQLVSMVDTLAETAEIWHMARREVRPTAAGEDRLRVA